MAEAGSGTLAPQRVAASPRALLVVDDDCVCIEASLGACRMLGVARGELVGRPVADLFEPASRERFAHVWLAFRGGGGHAEPFVLDAPATVGEVAATVTASVLPSRHLITLDPVASAGDARNDNHVARRRFAPPEELRAPTSRELEVLALLAGGRTDGQIAELLRLSVREPAPRRSPSRCSAG